MNLKSQLRYFLDLRELSASQLSKKSGVPKQSISGWLAGSNPRDIRQIKKVADTLNTSLDNLIFGTGIEASESKILKLEDLLSEQWTGGVFEIRLRKLRR